MLKYKLLQPDILEAMAGAGHNSRVLIADGNFPFSTKLGPKAKAVYMNLMPGVISCPQALEAIVSAIPIQGASVMAPATSGPYAMVHDPPVWGEFEKIFAANEIDVKLERLSIQDFYDLASCDEVALTIATGDQNWYSNVLLSIGAILPK